MTRQVLEVDELAPPEPDELPASPIPAAVAVERPPVTTLDRLRVPTPADRVVGWLVTLPGAISRSQSLHSNVLRFSMAKSRVLFEFMEFLKQEKKYWLMPIVVVFVLFGLLIVFSQSSAVAPFIYTLF